MENPAAQGRGLKIKHMNKTKLHTGLHMST